MDPVNADKAGPVSDAEQKLSDPGETAEDTDIYERLSPTKPLRVRPNALQLERSFD
jgi:hypothetical protein